MLYGRMVALDDFLFVRLVGIAGAISQTGLLTYIYGGAQSFST